MIRTAFILCVGIVALDAAEAAIARSTGLDYGWFTIVQTAVYIAIGGVLRRGGAAVGAVAGVAAVTALVEATAGWAVAVAILGHGAASVIEAVVIVPIVVLVMTAFALAGVGLASIGRRGASK